MKILTDVVCFTIRFQKSKTMMGVIDIVHLLKSVNPKKDQVKRNEHNIGHDKIIFRICEDRDMPRHVNLRAQIHVYIYMYMCMSMDSFFSNLISSRMILYSIYS